MKYLTFVFLTILAWGSYGPVMHEGQHALGHGGHPALWTPLLLMGTGWSLVAVLWPLVMMHREGPGGWSRSGMAWSFLAGVLGATGSVGTVLAFARGGAPLFVMPLIFGLAPVINTVVTALMTGTLRRASILFYLGVLVVAIGAAGVMFFNPDSPPASETTASRGDGFRWLIGSVAVTAVCWGSYGPVLHRGQVAMGNRRLRAWMFTGLAYLALVVILPLACWPWLATDPGTLNSTGIVWSLLAGACGAMGALGVIQAFAAGGRPVTVMPLVFGGAPVLNTLITTITHETLGQLPIPFYASLFLVIAGAITVLRFAPGETRPPVIRPEAGTRPRHEESDD